MGKQAELRREEIARERGRYRPTIVALRLAELGRLLTARHGGDVLSEDDAGRDDVAIVAAHLAYCRGDQARRIAAWIALRAPWMSPNEIEAVVTRATAKPRRWRADTLAKRMNLTEAERRRLRIRTIGAVDRTKEQRAEGCRERKRSQNRERDRQQRRAAGKPTRRQYLQHALSNTQPWRADGISRRTWERRRARVASPPPHIVSQYMQPGTCDTGPQPNLHGR